MAGVEIDCVQLRLVLAGETAGFHKSQGGINAGSHLFVALAQRRRGHELLVPRVHLLQVGETAFGEGAQQVERGRGLMVGGDEPLGLWHAGIGGKSRVVDDVASE